MLQKQAGHDPMRHVILVPGVSPVRSRRGAHYDQCGFAFLDGLVYIIM